jgi:hypothetical protein
VTDFVDIGVDGHEHGAKTCRDGRRIDRVVVRPPARTFVVPVPTERDGDGPTGGTVVGRFVEE